MPQVSTSAERRLRPVDLGREHGLSTQAVRNYEEAGILPVAERTEYGYRIYRPRHAQALRTFVALLPAYGHHTASTILRAVHAGDLDAALLAIDDCHAQLRTDRETLGAVEQTLHEITSAEPAAPEREVFVGQLAHQLRVRPATLRNWEAAGLIAPRRDRHTGYRVYTATDVRDAHLIHQLRRVGYLLGQIAPLLEHVRSAGGIEPLRGSLRDWHEALTRRGRAMLAGAAELHTYLCEHPATGPTKTVRQ